MLGDVIGCDVFVIRSVGVVRWSGGKDRGLNCDFSNQQGDC